LIKEVATAPEVISEKDLVVYKTIEIKNNGEKEWPKGVVLQSQGEIKGDGVLQPLLPGKKMTTVLVIRSPGKAGVHKLPFRVSYNSGKGTEFIGEVFEVSFEIKSSGKKPDVVAPVKADVKPVFPQYPKDVVEKAKILNELFSQNPLDFYLDYVDQPLVKQKSVNELISDYLAFSVNK